VVAEQQRPISEVVSRIAPRDQATEELEHFVGVDWIKTVALEQAIKEKGVLREPLARSLHR
jgi:hypothetical protein